MRLQPHTNTSSKGLTACLIAKSLLVSIKNLTSSDHFTLKIAINPISAIRSIFVVLFTLMTLSISYNSVAGPWIEPGDEQLRHHIQVLADAGVITVPVTTWPLMWSGIAADIERPTKKLTESQRWSLDYVRFEYGYQTSQDIRKTYRLGVRNEPNIVRDFSSDQREKIEFEATHDWVGDWLAMQLNVTTVDDPLIESDDTRVRGDGSYISALIGNWSVTLGAIDHWWGPGWETSLILSNSARPVPGITIQRNVSLPFESKWLSWIGPWHMTAFAGQLESDRVIPEAKFLGMRVGFRPVDNLEIALSRTAQWGGEGRPQSLSSLWDVITGDDNLTVSLDENDNRFITDEELANEPSNQMAGIDYRFSFDTAGVRYGFYGQLIGEDESNYAPSKKIVLLGLDSVFELEELQHRIVVEAFDTAVDSFGGESLYNVAYSHSTYRSGYTYKGRQMAAWTGNDTRLISISGDHYFKSSAFGWKVQRIELNRDGLVNSGALGESEDLKVLSFNYDQKWNYLFLGVSLGYLSENLNGGSVSKSFGGLEAVYRL